MDAPEGSDAVATALNRHLPLCFVLLDRRSAPGACGGIRQDAAITMQTRSLPALS